MSKFGLLEETQPDQQSEPDALSQKIAAFPPMFPKHRIDVAEMDQAAASHGFVSREALPIEQEVQGRRRRVAALEPSRHLAMRVPVSQYKRFVAYADRHKLTYHDALARLLDQAQS